MLILGPLVALFGNSHFPLIGAIIGGATMFDTLFFTCAFMGYIGTTTWLWVCFGICLVFSIIFGVFLGKHIKIIVVLNAIVFGLTLGLFVYGLSAYFFDWVSFWGMFGIAIAGGVIGAIQSCYRPQDLVIWGTSFFGAYLFMRGLSATVEPDFMTEHEIITKLYNDQPIVFDETYLFYFIVFLLFFIFSVFW